MGNAHRTPPARDARSVAPSPPTPANHASIAASAATPDLLCAELDGTRTAALRDFALRPGSYLSLLPRDVLHENLLPLLNESLSVLSLQRLTALWSFHTGHTPFAAQGRAIVRFERSDVTVVPLADGKDVFWRVPVKLPHSMVAVTSAGIVAVAQGHEIFFYDLSHTKPKAVWEPPIEESLEIFYLGAARDCVVAVLTSVSTARYVYAFTPPLFAGTRVCTLPAAWLRDCYPLASEERICVVLNCSNHSLLVDLAPQAPVRQCVLPVVAEAPVLRKHLLYLTPSTAAIAPPQWNCPAFIGMAVLVTDVRDACRAATPHARPGCLWLSTRTDALSGQVVTLRCGETFAELVYYNVEGGIERTEALPSGWSAYPRCWLLCGDVLVMSTDWSVLWLSVSKRTILKDWPRFDAPPNYKGEALQVVGGHLLIRRDQMLTCYGLAAEHLEHAHAGGGGLPQA